MSEKVKVVVNAAKGKTKNLEGHTVIAFAIDDAADMLEGAKGVAAHVVTAGEKIPTPIFADVISQIMTSLVKQTCKKQPMLAAYQLSAIADELNKQCGEINENIRDSVDDEKELDDMIEGLLRTIFD